MSFTFTVNGEPASKARARHAVKAGKVRTYTPKSTVDAQEAVTAAYQAQGGPRGIDPEAAYRVDAIFHHAKLQRRDVDNMLKLVMDGLNGVAWPDDNQVVEVHGRKEWTTEKDARVVVTITEVGVMPKLRKKCKGCGEMFVTWQSQINLTRFCSVECRASHRQKVRTTTCQQCGNDFELNGPQKASAATFCSRDCRSEHDRVTVTCDWCKKDFTRQRCFVRKSNYCCTECVVEARKIRRTTKFKGVCQVCGGGVTRPEYKRCNACRMAGMKPCGAPRPAAHDRVMPVHEKGGPMMADRPDALPEFDPRPTVPFTPACEHDWLDERGTTCTHCGHHQPERRRSSDPMSITDILAAAAGNNDALGDIVRRLMDEGVEK